MESSTPRSVCPSGKTELRFLFAGLLVLSVLPIAHAGLTYQDPVGSPIDDSTLEGQEDVTFLSVQGRNDQGETARAIALNTTTKEVLWKHDRYMRYFDIDPVGEDRVLFAAASGRRGRNMSAYLVDWRTDEEILRFDLPRDTHDVDRLNETAYVYVGRFTDSIHVYNTTRNRVTWEWDLKDHFLPEAGKGDGYSNDYSHVNDVDSVADGEAFLISPRNFDRVMLVNRTTGGVEWVLGEEDNDDVLNEQHNPALLTTDPPTVVVADSENDRVVEFRRSNGTWNETWSYADVDWPRDADRLPNGNTMIADTHNQRFLEVTPNGSIVWSTNATHWPYDVERLAYGDEPSGPRFVAMGPSKARTTPVHRGH
jgi:hypothetical protein